MWNKIKQFYWMIVDIIQTIKVGFETIKEYNSELTEWTPVSQEPIKELSKFREEIFENARKGEKENE